MQMKRKVEKMKKYIALLLSALMVLCLFAGCGTQESETSEPPAAESADPVETAGAGETEGGYKFGRKTLYIVMIKFVAPILLFVLLIQSVGLLRI